jgi:hypothetical protein
VQLLAKVFDSAIDLFIGHCKPSQLFRRIVQRERIEVAIAADAEWLAAHGLSPRRVSLQSRSKKHEAPAPITPEA